MSEYNFIAKDKQGNTIQHLIEAESRYEAADLLKARGLTVISISAPVSPPKSRPESGVKKVYAAIVRKLRSALAFRRGISRTELYIFFRQLSVSIASGIPLVDSLLSIAGDMDNAEFRRVLLEVAADIRAGKHFSEAIALQPKVFKPLYVALIKAAEESGSLPTVLQYLSVYLEKSLNLERKIRNITTYPAFIVGFFLIVLTVITAFILPRFESLFAGFGAELPPLSMAVFRINRFFLSHIIYWLIIILAAVGGLIIFGRTAAGRYNIDELKLNLPFLGKWIRKFSIARFCSIFAVVIRGGVPLVEALRIASQTCGNKALEASFNRIREQVTHGADIAGSLRKDANFPRLVARMVSVGESSGRLPDVLDDVSALYEQEVDGSISVATSLFEPFIIVVFGGVILMLVLAIYVPVFKISISMGAAG